MVMKKILLSVLGLVAYQGIAQQSFTGLRTSTYGGVLTTLSNPAHALGARPWDATLLSIDANLNSNAIGLNWDLKGSFNKFTKDLAAGETTSVNAGINADVVGPSFIVRVNKENAVGLVSRMRLMAGTTGIDANLLQALINGKDMDLSNNVSQYRDLRGISDMNLLANAFREIGAVWSYTAMNDGYNLLRVGAGVKLVQGTGSFRMGFKGANANNFKLGKNSQGDVILHVGDAEAEVRSGGLDVLNGSPDFFGTAATTVGVDLGVIYEYKEDGCPNCDGHVPYRFKVGVSLLDLGKLNYETNKNSYRYHIQNQDIKIDDIQAALDRIPAPEKLAGKTFSSSLPTTLNVNLDYRFVDGVYLNFSSQLNMVPKNEYNAYYGNDFVLTPRYETHWGGGVFGAYLPISYNSVSSLNAGVALQVGPLVLGSRSVFGNLIGTAKELNAFVGLRFGNIYQ
jgi:outer membrane protein, ompA family